MELKTSELSRRQFKSIVSHIFTEFGMNAAIRVQEQIEHSISQLPIFPYMYPELMHEAGFSVRRLIYKKTCICYTVFSDIVYIVCITDTRMSQTNVRLLIKDELNRLKLGTNGIN